jgi:rhamnogalacturonan endolyase
MLKLSSHRFLRAFRLFIFFFTSVISIATNAQRKMEKLGRGVVAVRTSSSNVFISWRLLGTEPSDLAFNIYRGSTKINSSPITGATNYTDASVATEEYTVVPVLNGSEQTVYPSGKAMPWASLYKQVPLQQPPGGVTPAGEAYTYSPNDGSVGDVDGDGEYEIILKWDPSNSKDNSQSGYTGNVYIDAYKMDGTMLWRIDLGRNIRAGAHYTQFLVYDFDSDGKAEIVCKTADGTKDGAGTIIGNAGADYRNSSGYVLSGAEYLTVFNGLTGAAMATTNYLPARGTVSSWGDSYGNRVDRFIACVAYLDGVNPSIVMGRGYYTRLVRVAWDWRNGQLTQRWIFDSNTSGNSSYASMGNHQMTVGDVDGDGKDEFCNGASAINDDGTGLYANGLGHGDALHMTDMDPDRPGQEVWQCHEEPARYGNYGLEFRDAKTGQPLWGVAGGGADVGRAMAADIDPRYKGYEVWGAVGGLYTCKGQQISTSRPSINFGLWWDGDLQRELFDASYNSTTGVSTVRVDKWNYLTNSSTRLLTPSLPELGLGQTNNTTKANPVLSADLFGDWREEFILRSADNQFLNIYTTTTPTNYRIYTLMHDPQYRLAIAWQNSAYNQPPHPSFYLGEQMAPPPVPNITLVDAATLPVKLLSFNAAAKGKSAVIEWTATNEISSDRYVLQRSNDGINFKDIATVADKGNTGTVNKYSYIDNTAGDISYYRLKQVNVDGSFNYSAIRQVKFTSTAVSVYPNPASTFIKVTLRSGDTIKAVSIYTVHGKLVYAGGINTLQQTIDISQLAAGTYIVKVTDGAEVSTHKITKQ